MKTNFKFLLIFSLFALFLVNSCQNEVVEVTNNQEQTFDPNSNLANLTRATATNDGSVDNIIDNSDCFSIELPVTIIANGITITIDSLEDFELIEEIFDEFENDEDIIEYLFPITIILNDYTEIVIENIEQLEEFIDECVEIDDDDVIECVDFVYPISFSIFNSDFVVIDTVVIHNDEELYDFLEELENPTDGAIIVSLNYPVSLIYADGTIVEVNSNQELEAAINAALHECENDEYDDDCELEDLQEYLVECYWELAQNGTGNVEIEFHFGANGVVEVVNTSNDNVVSGTWELTETDAGLVLTITSLTDFADDFNGSWLVEDCDEDWLVLLGETPNGTVFELFLISACDDDVYDCPDMQANYGDECFTANGSIGYVNENCECEDDEIDPFDCYDDVVFAVCDLDDVNDGFTEFDLELIYANCPTDDVEVTFHLTNSDAETDVAPLSSPYTNVENPQTIYARVALAGSNEIFEIFEVELFVEDCSQSDCTEEDVAMYLIECAWIPDLVNGSDDFDSFYFVFHESGELTVEGNGANYTGEWDVSTNPNGLVVLTITGLDAQLQGLNGEFLVLDCSEELMIISDNDTEIHLDRHCD